MEPLVRQFAPAGPLDLRLTLAVHHRGPRDPTLRFSADGSVWRATRTPDGPATLRLIREGDVVRAQAWGPGAGLAIEQAPELAGALDDAAEFGAVVAGHPLLRALHGRFPGIRIGRTRRVMEALVPAIIEQKVTGDEARAAFVALVRLHGDPTPGPWDDTPGSRLAPLRIQPDAQRLAGLPGYAYHPLGLGRHRADTIRFAAAHAVRAEECADMALPDGYARLRAFPLVGAWTAAEVGLRAFGDPDAVSVGDYHLCHAVCQALAGEPRGSDKRMLELLAPFAGHRARVIRLIEVAGIHAPRRGPRYAPRSITDI